MSIFYIVSYPKEALNVRDRLPRGSWQKRCDGPSLRVRASQRLGDVSVGKGVPRVGRRKLTIPRKPRVGSFGRPFGLLWLTSAGGAS